MEGTLWSFYQRQAFATRLTRAMAISVSIHVLIALVALVLPGLRSPRNLDAHFYSVDLVTLDQIGTKGAGGGSGGLPRKGSPQMPSVSRPNAPLPVMPVERLKAQPLADSSTPLKKLEAPAPTDKTATATAPAIDKTLEKLTAKPKQGNEPPVAKPPPEGTKPSAGAGSSSPQEAGAKPGKRSEASGSGVESGHEAGTGRGGTGKTATGEGGSQGSGADAGEIGLARRLYYTEVWNLIRREWVLDTSRLKGQHLEAVIVLTVRRDGKILSQRFERKSGNALLDESAERAIRKVDVLPPFPKIYSPAQEEIGIRFRPEDL